MLSLAARRLRNLPQPVVYLGSAVVELHLPESAYPDARTVEDVDCLLDVTGQQYASLCRRFEDLGLRPRSGGPPYRWEYFGIVIDAMPVDEEVLGFKNEWHRGGLAHAERLRLPDRQEISAFSLPYLLASKLKAFSQRGRGDFESSPDLSDCLTLIAGGTQVREALERAPDAVRVYLQDKFQSLLADARFAAGIRSSNPSRAEAALPLIKDLAENL